MTRFVFSLVLTFFLLHSNSLNLYANSASGNCYISGWPSENSDILPDPGLVRGVLENGFRYVVMENHEPENRVALYLYVNVGSLYEQLDQRGIAHYLEHMLFNGSTNFEPGELVEFFQEIGMNFGGDTNAHTSYEETLYEIILPDGKEETLKKGLLVMSDYARGASLLESEVERERGVILAEKRDRDSVGYRVNIEKTKFKYRGTLLAERPVIGVEQVLKSVNRQSLKKFYDSWYRPDNMMLVMVGDIEPHSITPIIEEMFTPLKAEGEKNDCPEFGTLAHSGIETFYYEEKELGRAEVTIDTLRIIDPTRDSIDVRREELQRFVSNLILNDRLKKMMESEGNTINDAGYYSGPIVQHIQASTIAAKTDAGKWGDALKALDTALRQAIEFGFTEVELQRVKKDIHTMLESAVTTVDGRNSESISRRIVKNFRENRVYQSPDQELNLYSPLLKEINLDDINRMMRNDWSSDSRLVSVVGDAAFLTDKPDKEILAAYTRISEVDVANYNGNVTVAFPYLTAPSVEGDIVKSKKVYDSIDITTFEFENNIVVSLKKTDFEPNIVRVIVDVGHGRLSEDIPGMAMLTQAVVNNSGTGKLTGSELGDVLSGTTVDVDFNITEQSFRWTGRSLTTDFELLMQLLYTVLNDPGFRAPAYKKAQNRISQMYNRLQSDIHGAMDTEVKRFLANGDKRIGLPSREVVSGMQLDQVREWLLSLIKKGCIEITVVGDIDPEYAISLVQRYFGGLAQRDPVKNVSSSLDFPQGQVLRKEINSSVKKSMVIVAWPTGGMWDIERTRRLNVLADIFRERLRQVVREKLGASYSPKVFSLPSRIYGDYGKLMVQVVVAPDKELEIADEIFKIAEDIQQNGITEDELERSRGPILTMLKDSVKSNDYWLYSVMVHSGKHPEKLLWPETLLSDYSKITLNDIEGYAKEYLHREKSATAIITTVQ